MIESSKFRSTVKKSTDQLMYYVVLYMQITEEQVILGTQQNSHAVSQLLDRDCSAHWLNSDCSSHQ